MGSQTENDSYDAVIVGSGINSLVAGAILSKEGWKVLLCERNDRPGGAIRTEAATLPGYVHELLSSWHPLFVGGPSCYRCPRQRQAPAYVKQPQRATRQPR